jgi:hypothetical protein
LLSFFTSGCDCAENFTAILLVDLENRRNDIAAFGLGLQLFDQLAEFGQCG